MEWTRDAYLITDDAARADLDAVHDYLTHSYWAAGIPRETVARSLRGSLCFSLFSSGLQSGFARVITDRATFAYLADVYVLEEHRGRGLSRWMMQIITGHPDLQGLRRWSLVTRDAHGLYAKCGFKPLAASDRHMERVDSEIYRREAP